MATTTLWSYLQNPFDNVTKRNLKKMLLMATDHFAKLKNEADTDANIAQIYRDFAPVFKAFQDQYELSNNNKAVYEMHTQLFENKIAELSSTAIGEWDIEMQFIIGQKSPEYTMLMSKGRAIFQRGAYELRIDAVKSLATRLRNFPALSNLQQKVEVFGQEIERLRTEQQGVEKNESKYSDFLEDARQTLANSMQAIFGYLMYYYRGNIKLVENFYELKYLRSNTSTNADDGEDVSTIVQTVQNRIAAQATIEELVAQIEPTDEITIENTGDTTLEAWTSDNINTAAPANSLVISANQNAIFIAQDISNGGTSKLMLLNPDTVTGSFKVTLTRKSL